MNRNQILKKLSKSLPNGAVYTLDEIDQTDIGVIPTGIATLDYALGTGGFPRGWQSMIFGTASAGKTALILQTIGNYQKDHPESMSCIIDMENSADKNWAARFGVNTDNLVVLRPTDIEELVTMTVEAISLHCFDIIMVDSLAAGALKSEVEPDGKNRMAGSSGAITRLVKAVNNAIIDIERQIHFLESEEQDTSDYIIPAVIYINQARSNMDSMYGGIDFPGGHALGHMCGIIVKLRNVKSNDKKLEGTVDGVKTRVGWYCSASVEKNKLAVPYKNAGYNFVFADCPEYAFGIDNAQSVGDISLQLGISYIEGRTIYFPIELDEETGEVLYDKVVGRNNYYKMLKENDDICSLIGKMSSKKLSAEANDDDTKSMLELLQGK